jgi:tetratricopeptide (TPR) repeat protein
MSIPQKRFSIALSFPGEHRAFVEQVAAALSSQIGKERVLYDMYYEAEFARPNLDTHLQSLYHDDSELIAVFLCEDYERKEWCGLEWRAIRDLIKKRQASSVMPLRFDTIEIPGLFSTDGYVWIDSRSPLEIAAIILKRLEINANSITVSLPAPVSPALPVQAITSNTSAQSTAQSSSTPADYNPANRVFNVPFRPKGDQVIGRDDALQQVRDQLTQGKHTAIGHTAAFEGLGGLGKTQLAVEYAYRFKDSYPNGVIWINADQDINAQLTDIAVSARWIAPETEHKFKLDVALHRLCLFSGCLIIFDNVDDYASIEPFLPQQTATPHLLATSRTALTGFKAIHLNKLDENQSLQLLFQEAGRQAIGAEEDEAANKIVEQLDGLPLALELAGAYLCHRSTMSFVQYRDRLLSDPIKTLSNPYLASFTKHDADLYRALKIDEDVVQEEPLLADILDILTWSGPAAMGLSLMTSLLDKKESELSGALALGAQLKLLQKNAAEERYALHRLVREVRRCEQPLAGRDGWVNLVCGRLGDWFERLRQDFLQLPCFEAENDHLVAWRENAEHKTPLHVCRLTWLQAYPAYHRGMYQMSHDFVSRSREIYVNNVLTDTKLFANLLNDLGTIYGLLGNHTKSLECDEKALEIRQELLGELHQDTAMSYDNLGHNYDMLKNHRKALEYREKSLKIRREILGDRHSDTAGSYNGLGITYSFLEDHKTALKYKENALNIRRELLGEFHPDTAMSYNSVGVTYDNLRDYQKALDHKERGLNIFQKLFGERHPSTALLFNNIGYSHDKFLDHRKALEYYEKAIKVQSEFLGDCHPDSLTSYFNISTSYCELGRYDDAMRFMRKGCDLARNALPRKHPLLEQFERGISDVTEKMYRPGFRKPPLHQKKKKRK